MKDTTTKKSIDRFIVPWVKEIKPCNIDHIDYAWNHPDVDRLMTNENFHPPSEKVVEAVTEITRKGNCYPQDSIILRQKLANLEGLNPENVFIANGSLEVMDVIARVFIAPDDEAVIPLPTYPMYALRVKLCGGIVHHILPTNDIAYDIEGVIEKVTPRTRLIFIASPNNPMGSVVSEYEVRRVLNTGVPTVIDEVYYELEEEPKSMKFLLDEYSNLIVMRSMSKAWGLAGFRIGYSLASQMITDYFNRMKIAFNIGVVNLAAAIAAFDDIEHFHAQNKETKMLRKELETQLRKIEGLRVFPSSANFILIDAGSLGINTEQIVDHFLKHNILLRSMNKPELGPGYFRVTIGNRQQNERFVKLLKDFLFTGAT
jgi:histidinol-phosphate aminotransferase